MCLCLLLCLRFLEVCYCAINLYMGLLRLRCFVVVVLLCNFACYFCSMLWVVFAYLGVRLAVAQ